MKRNALLSLLASYSPSLGEEQNMYRETMKFVQNNPDCFERTTLIGHVTGSAWVISPERDRVLLMHHKKLDRWFQPGGHCDGDSNVASVAEKEVREETGISKVRMIQTGIFDIDVHLIPANTRETAHYHYDIRFLFEGDPKHEIVGNAESKDVMWVSLSRVNELNDSESILRMVRKVI